MAAGKKDMPNPFMTHFLIASILDTNVRMLFTPEQLEKVTGRGFYDCDWVEPISGRLDLESKKWAGEHDPMAPLQHTQGWIEAWP